MAQVYEKGSKPDSQLCLTIRKFLLKTFLVLRYWMDILIDKAFQLHYKTPEKVPDAKNPLVLESATSLARKIRERKITCEEVVQVFVDRIREVNSLINAVVDERFDDALKEAKKVDLDIATGQILDVDFLHKPFLGVPFTSKESTACRGMSFTFGLISRKNRKASFDAEVVEKMKKSGAILLAVTNVPQLNMWQETSNPVYGLTRNPYDTTRNVGGSSGGEGAIIAAGGSPFGIGTDIGGSARIPAYMCGIYGHKPTANLISTRGMTFRTGRECDTMVTAGPMVKHAEDLAPFLKILLGEKCHSLRLDEPINVHRHIRIHYTVNPKDPFVSPFRKDVKDVMARIVEYFKKNSAQNKGPYDVHFQEMEKGGKLWRYWMTQEPDVNFNRDITNREGEASSWQEIIKYAVKKSDFTAAVIFNLINAILPRENEKWAQEATKLLQFKLTNLLGDDGVLIYPSAPWVASYHHSAFLRPWNFNLFSIWNALKFPVTQVPLGLNNEGLPMGVQVIATPNNDRLAIAVAKELERAFGGYKAPFQIRK